MNLHNAPPGFFGRVRQLDLAIQPSRPEQSGVQNVRPVRRRDHLATARQVTTNEARQDRHGEARGEGWDGRKYSSVICLLDVIINDASFRDPREGVLGATGECSQNRTASDTRLGSETMNGTRHLLAIGNHPRKHYHGRQSALHALPCKICVQHGSTVKLLDALPNIVCVCCCRIQEWRSVRTHAVLHPLLTKRVSLNPCPFRSFGFARVLTADVSYLDLIVAAEAVKLVEQFKHGPLHLPVP